MSDALEIIKYIFTKQLNFMFNDLQMFTGVTIGWVLAVITIFSILIHNVVNLAKSAPSQRIYGYRQIEDNKYVRFNRFTGEEK